MFHFVVQLSMEIHIPGLARNRSLLDKVRKACRSMGKLQMSVLIQLTNTVTAKPPKKTVVPIQINGIDDQFW